MFFFEPKGKKPTNKMHTCEKHLWPRFSSCVAESMSCLSRGPWPVAWVLELPGDDWEMTASWAGR